jgi:hypothetical protein
VRSVVANEGTRNSDLVSTRPANTSLSRRHARQTVSPSGTASLCRAVRSCRLQAASVAFTRRRRRTPPDTTFLRTRPRTDPKSARSRPICGLVREETLLTGLLHERRRAAEERARCAKQLPRPCGSPRSKWLFQSRKERSHHDGHPRPKWSPGVGQSKQFSIIQLMINTVRVLDRFP